MKHALPPRVHRKRSKGRTYLYFNTGRKNAAGKPILTRLPDYASNGFGRAYAACMEAMADPQPAEDAMTVPQFCETFRRSAHFRKKSDGTKESYNTYLRVIETQLNTLFAEEVTSKDVLALQEKLSANPAAANQTIRTLSALYAWGKKPEISHVTHNPAAGIEFYPGGEHEPWPEWLIQKALKSKDQRVRLTVHLLYYTAARIGDVSRLKWSDIVDNHWELLQQKKSNRNSAKYDPEPISIPLHKNLRALLDTLPKGLTTIIHRPDGKPYSVMTIRTWLQEFGIDHGVEVVPHGLRKNAVNSLLEAGCTVAQAQAISDQSLQVIEHYARKRNKRKLGGDAMKIWEENETCQ